MAARRIRARATRAAPSSTRAATCYSGSSRGARAARARRPGVYSRVSTYKSWVCSSAASAATAPRRAPQADAVADAVAVADAAAGRPAEHAPGAALWARGDAAGGRRDPRRAPRALQGGVRQRRERRVRRLPARPLERHEHLPPQDRRLERRFGRAAILHDFDAPSSAPPPAAAATAVTMRWRFGRSERGLITDEHGNAVVQEGGARLAAAIEKYFIPFMIAQIASSPARSACSPCSASACASAAARPSPAAVAQWRGRRPDAPVQGAALVLSIQAFVPCSSSCSQSVGSPCSLNSVQLLNNSHPHTSRS